MDKKVVDKCRIDSKLFIKVDADFKDGNCCNGCYFDRGKHENEGCMHQDTCESEILKLIDETKGKKLKLKFNGNR